MFNIGPVEMLVIAVIALIVFGPQRLPEMARTVGRALAEFKRQAGDIRDEFESSFDTEDEDPAPPEGRRPDPALAHHRTAASDEDDEVTEPEPDQTE